MARRIVIVGGGVIGASVAWHLADRGLGDVILLERDRLGSAAQPQAGSAAQPQLGSAAQPQPPKNA
jgi:sarcosine oxidase subunit beta